MEFNFAEFKQDFLFALAEYSEEVKELLNTDQYRIVECNVETNGSRWLTKNLLFSENYLESGIFLDGEARKIVNSLRANSPDAVAFYLEPTYYASDFS